MHIIEAQPNHMLDANIVFDVAVLLLIANHMENVVGKVNKKRTQFKSKWWNGLIYSNIH